MKSSEELLVALRSAGRKITVQRRAVVQALVTDEGHTTAEAVWHRVRNELPAVSLRTVYQTLNELVSIGELQALDLGTGSTRFDLATAAHHHLVCDDCGRVEDIWRDFTGSDLPADAARGFSVTRTDIVFRGTCPTCLHAGSGDAITERHPHHNQENN